MSVRNAAVSMAAGSKEQHALLNIDEAAERLNVTTRFIRRLIAERRIAHLKIGKFIRFDRGELDRWIDEQRVDRAS